MNSPKLKPYALKMRNRRERRRAAKKAHWLTMSEKLLQLIINPPKNMKLWLKVRLTTNPDTGLPVWEWYFEDAHGFVAGGYAATKTAALADAAHWRKMHDAKTTA